MTKPAVLFLCTGNSARSQMAEAFLRHHAGDRYDAYSAGLEPHGVNPFTIRIMDERGIDIHHHTSDPIQDMIGLREYRYVVTVCAHADANCPAVFLQGSKKLHWYFDDPAAAQGTDDAILQKFREIRDQIEARVVAWLDETR